MRPKRAPDVGDLRDPLKAIRRPLVCWGITFVLALLVFCFTVAPSITLNDSGELILACALPGIAHPPGFPLYTLLGHLVSKLPGGTVAFRINLMSAFLGAAAAASTTLAIRELLLMVKGTQHIDVKERPRVVSVTPLVALIGGLLFAFSPTLWGYSTVAEVYTLGLALLASVLALLFHFMRTGVAGSAPAGWWVLPLAGLFMGLAFANHHVTALLTVPALLYGVVATGGIRFLKGRVFLVTVAAVVLGCAVYLYLPIVARTNPILDWGDPRTLEHFYWHVSAKQYHSYVAFSADQGATALLYWLRLMSAQFTPIGLVLGLGGGLILLRKNRKLLWLLLLLIVCNVLYCVGYQTDQDKDAYYLVSGLSLLLFVCVALAAALERLSVVRASRQFRAGLIVVLLLPIGQAFLNVRECNHRHDTVARRYVTDAFSNIEPGGLLLNDDWQLTSALFYMRYIEGFRKTRCQLPRTCCNGLGISDDISSHSFPS